MKFMLVMEQDAGCDYTIGCGLAIVLIEGDSRNDAIELAFREMAADYADSPRLRDDIDRAFIYEIQGEEIALSVNEFRQELHRQERNAQLSKDREAERKEYLRLKAKYENS